MKKKIYSKFILISLIAIIITFIVTTIIYNNLLNKSALVPVLIGALLFVVIICIIFAHITTKNIISPIENLSKDISQIDETKIYKELEPLIKTIKEQNSDILKNASMRSDFTANVTHELKTPLTAILGYSELIENGMASEEDIIRFGKEIHKNSKRLLRLIDDIIKLSEIDSVYHQVEFEDVDLYQLACECVDMLQISAEKNNVSLSVKGKSQIIRANKSMMEDLIYNLCENAIRYNKNNGKVEVVVDSCKCKSRAQDANDVNNSVEETCLVVKDTGIGISKKHQKRIFERFYRVDKSRSKSTGGTGLGLAIVKHVVAQHNATIELDSLPGIGTTIKIVFHK